MNTNEVSLSAIGKIFIAHHLLDVCVHLRKENRLPLLTLKEETQSSVYQGRSDVKGQLGGKRALEITAYPAAIIFCL
ncbi:hypothetical protein [Candidatus Coxiella mudrowiae]|uniref:hypothetical protein n=1 Tax=Candidatus Coxiella mudrowiae TaxID=2054173 RepID=UPI00138DFB6D|nr:hypothetical protein [Candidatus Coxiella mudrowiae]